MRRVLQGGLYYSGQEVRLGFLHHGKTRKENFGQPISLLVHLGPGESFSRHHGKAASYSGSSGEAQGETECRDCMCLRYLFGTDAIFKVPTGSIQIKLYSEISNVLNSITGAGNSTRQVQSLTPPWFCFCFSHLNRYPHPRCSPS